MAGEYDGTPALKDIKGSPVPCIWDSTLTNPDSGNQGYWRVPTPADLAADALMTAPSSNIARTLVPTDTAVQLPAGACAKGFLLRADRGNGAGLVYWGAAGVDASHGDVLEAGDAVFIHLTDTDAIWVLAGASACYVRGTRF